MKHALQHPSASSPSSPSTPRLTSGTKSKSSEYGNDEILEEDEQMLRDGGGWERGVQGLLAQKRVRKSQL